MKFQEQEIERADKVNSLAVDNNTYALCLAIQSLIDELRRK